MIGAGLIGSGAHRRSRRSVAAAITAARAPASSDLRVGEMLGNTDNWSVFLDPSNYAPSAPDHSIATVTVNYIGSAASATEVLEDGDQNSFSVTVVDTGAVARTFTVVPRTVRHVAPTASAILENQSFEIATGVQNYAIAGAFSGAGLVFGVTGPTGVTVDPVTGDVAFDTQVLGVQTGTGITIRATNSGGTAVAGFDLNLMAASVVYAASLTGLGNNAIFGLTAEIAQPLSGAISNLQGDETIVHRWRDTVGLIAGADGPVYTPVATQDLDAVQYAPLVNNQEIISDSATVRYVSPVADTLAPVRTTQGRGAVQVALQPGFLGDGLTYSTSVSWASVLGNVLTIEDAVRNDSAVISASNSGGAVSLDLDVIITASVSAAYNFTNSDDGFVTFESAGPSPVPEFQDNEDGTLERIA